MMPGRRTNDDRRWLFYRNRNCFMFGCSWSHHPSFSRRLTHFYLGAWVLTHRTKEVQ